MSGPEHLLPRTASVQVRYSAAVESHTSGAFTRPPLACPYGGACLPETPACCRKAFTRPILDDCELALYDSINVGGDVDALDRFLDWSRTAEIAWPPSTEQHQDELQRIQPSSVEASSPEMHQRSSRAAAFSKPPDFASTSAATYNSKELLYLAAALQPVSICHVSDADTSTIPHRRSAGFRVSTDAQSVAARHRRARIRCKLKALQEMVPGGASMDTASMLDEAVQYIAFLKMEVEAICEGNSRLLL